MTAGVYKIACVTNGRIYIGSSGNIEKRWGGHKRDLKMGRHKSRHLQRAWDKYGENAFCFEILAIEDFATARHALEQRFLDKLSPFGRNGFNSCRFVRVTTGLKLTAEQRLKIAAANRGRKHSEATKLKLSLSKRGMRNPQFGRPITAKQREYFDSLSTSAHPWRGRSHSDETKSKISAAKSRKIWQVDHEGNHVRLWCNGVVAAEALGLKGPDRIYRVLSGQAKTAAGFYWMYDGATAS